MSATPFDTVLVANRGEIAVRILRSCRALGLATVAVHSEADRDAAHVRLADRAVCLGPAPAAQSYRAIEGIVAAALHSGAQAVHPGYGFLAENAAFAEAVQQAGLVFIGPDPATIAAMGDKAAARQRLGAAGLPCVPGYDGAAQDIATLQAEALQLGYPVMLKAAAGGGGRGMRRVDHADALPAQYAAARSEALQAFGDARLLLEKAVLGARHVEVQIFGDRHGGLIHLGERECSLQRRHQKILEEAPSPAVDEALRERLGAAALAAARTVGYVGAGTVEFLLAPDGAFYFLEMNTRLQVEHGVTEGVYDVDLVAWQLRIAAGEPLPLDQAAIATRRRGWAMQVRLCAEDALQDFRPQTGRVLAWRPAAGEGIRVDHGLTTGDEIGVHYDSLQAKFIAVGDTREQARRRLLAALRSSVLLGVVSNRDFLIALLADTRVVQADFSTTFVEQQFLSRYTPTLVPGYAEELAAEQAQTVAPKIATELAQAIASRQRHTALAAALLLALDAQALQRCTGLVAELCHWRSSPGDATPLRLGCGEEILVLRLYRQDDGGDLVECVAGGAAGNAVGTIWRLRLRLLQLAEGEAAFEFDGSRRRVAYALEPAAAGAGARLWLDADSRIACYEDLTHAATRGAPADGDGRLLAPMDGRIVALQTQPGAAVRKGDTLAVLESMKMEFPVVADADGVVAEIGCAVGDQVRARQLLIRLQAT